MSMNFICASVILLFLNNNNFFTALARYDSIPQCACSWSYKINFPKTAKEKNISGDVVIEISVDSTHYLYNPIIVKNLEVDCDKEALRICKLIIMQVNTCQKKCGYNNNLNPGKIQQTVTFDSTE